MANKKTTYREPDDYFPKEIYDKYFGKGAEKKKATAKKSTTAKKTTKK